MNALQARIAATFAPEQLLELLRELDARPSLDENERLVYAALADELTARWDIDAEVGVIFADIDFDGSYLQAIEQAITLKRDTLDAQR